MIVNIESEGNWEFVKEGFEAGKRAVEFREGCSNPYGDDSPEYDYWELGRMAVEHGWDIEW